jgi:DNA-binding NtrC family response regulator
VLLGAGEALLPEDLPAELRTARGTGPERRLLALQPDGVNLADLERDLVEQALQMAEGNQTRAARLLGMNRDQMRYRIEKFGLTRKVRR